METARLKHDLALYCKPSCSSESCVWGVVNHDVLGSPVPVALPCAAHMALLVGWVCLLPMAFFRGVIVPAISNILESLLQLWIFKKIAMCITISRGSDPATHHQTSRPPYIFPSDLKEAFLTSQGLYFAFLKTQPHTENASASGGSGWLSSMETLPFEVPCVRAIRIPLLKVSQINLCLCSTSCSSYL